MIESRFGRQNGPLERLSWLLAVVLTAVFMTCIHMATTPTFRLASFTRLVNFDAVEPFQHRVLLPSIVAAIQHFIPLGGTLLFGLLEVAGWVALIVLAYRALVRFEVGRCALTQRILAFTILIPMFLHLVAPDVRLIHPDAATSYVFDFGTWKTWPLFYYVYDLPAGVFTLAMLLILAQQYRTQTARGVAAYLAVFVLASLNRETAAFMVPLFAVMFWARMPVSRWLLLIAAQVALFAAIQWPLHWLFQGNVNPNGRLAGTAYEYHLFQNLGLLAQPLYLAVFAARFAAGLYLPILLWRRYLDRRLGLALVCLGLPLIFFALLAGRVVEHRIFIELVPLIWLAAMQVIAARSAVAMPDATPAGVADELAARRSGDVLSPPEPGALGVPAAAVMQGSHER